MKILLFLFPLALFAQDWPPCAVAASGKFCIDRPQYPHEMLALEWAATEIQYDKAPIDAALEPVWFALSDAPVAVVDADAQWVEVHDDGGPRATLVGYPQQTIPVNSPAAQVGVVQCASPVCVSFASQGPAALKAITGKLVKGLQVVEADLCVKSGTFPFTVPVGAIVGMGNAYNLGHIDSGLASAIVNQTVDRGWRNVVKVVTTEGLAIAASVFVPGIVAVNKAETTGVTLGYIFMNHEGNLLAPGAPAPTLLTNGLKALADNVSFTAPGCQSVLYAAQYQGKSVQTGFIPLD